MKTQKLLKVVLSFVGFIFLIGTSQFGFAQSTVTDTTSVSLSMRAFEQLERKLGRQLQVKWNADNKTPLFLSGGLTAHGFVASYTSSQAAALSFIQEHSTLFQIKNATAELKLVKSSSDELGMTHLHFQQTYKDVPVWGSELIVHFNKDRSISSTNGRYLPTFDLSLSPVLSMGVAKASAKTRLQNAFGRNPNFDNIQSSLIIFPMKGQPHLAWLVTLPNRFSPNSKCIIDAISGDVLWVDTGIRN